MGRSASTSGTDKQRRRPGTSSRDGRKPWVDSFWQTADIDNDNLHPHLRHYFDRRGVEASYRRRPILDKNTPKLRPRTAKHKGFVYTAPSLSASSPSLSPSGQQLDPLDVSGRYGGSIQWGSRCTKYGPSLDAKEKGGEKIPWVEDHHICESDDNHGLPPTFRHYFDAEGIESSFENRGRESPERMRQKAIPTSTNWVVI